MGRRKLGIYVHIPFCVRKCAYCDFLSFPASGRTQEAYFRALREEIAAFESADEYEAVSVYFGGGTPSLPPAGEITDTLEVICRSFSVAEDAEITIECNPGTLDREKLYAYRKAGCSRLSLGLQSADDTLLKTLGRIHTWETFLREYHEARGAGFDNISVDLMYGLPGQTLAVWEDTLEKVTALAPEHLSAYSLIIEEGTPFWERYHEDDETKKRGDRTLFLPDEDEEGRMLEMLKSSLRDIGMHRYEISNYARPGRESRHNTGYWLRREYAGFGLGASGQIGKIRYRNQSSLTEYLKGVSEPEKNYRKPDPEGLQEEGVPGAEHPLWEEVTVLTREDEIAETMILGLRLTEGVDLQRFEETFSARAEDLFAKEITMFRREGLLELAGHHLRLTDSGFDVSNLVMSSFL